MLTRFKLAFGVLVCAQAFSLQAAASKEFPAETKWMLNLDMKAAQASPIINFVVDKLEPVKRQQAQNKLAAIKAMFGVDLIKDIDQLIMAGCGNAEKGGVAYVYGKFDAQRLSTIIAGSKNYTQMQHGGFTVMGWNDDKQKYISFAKPGLAMLSNSQTVLTDALDVLAGKQPGLAPNSVFRSALSGTGGNLLTVQAVDVSSLAGEQPKAQALKQAQALCLRVSATKADALDASLSVTAASDETAMQIQQAFMGIQALALLRSGDAPESATLASMAKINSQGRTVDVTLTLPQSIIATVIEQREARDAAKAAAKAARAAAKAHEATTVN